LDEFIEQLNLGCAPTGRYTRWPEPRRSERAQGFLSCRLPPSRAHEDLASDSSVLSSWVSRPGIARGSFPGRA